MSPLKENMLFYGTIGLSAALGSLLGSGTIYQLIKLKHKLKSK